MLKNFRTRITALIMALSFILFYSPYPLTGQIKDKGDLIGIVYGKNGITPLEGAIIRLRNLFTGSIYEIITDKLGTFKIRGIDKGLYVVGIITKEGNFNVENLIGIEANKITKVALALKPYVKGKAKKAELKGEQIEKLKEVSKIAKFFSSPLGIAMVVAANTAIAFGIVELTEEKAEVSPFKK